MNIYYYLLDPTGNITILVDTPVPEKKRAEVAAKLMQVEPSSEQVGFTQGTALNMAGGEFCGNATLSAAALYCRKNGIDSAGLELTVSGANKPVKVKIKKESPDEFTGAVEMPGPSEITETETEIGGKIFKAALVNFGGISHIILPENAKKGECEKALIRTCKKLGKESLGFIFTDGKALTPLVYVTSPETLVWESSCASGTAAAGIYFALKNGGFFSGTFAEPGGNLKIEVRGDKSGLLIPMLTGKVKIVKKETAVI